MARGGLRVYLGAAPGVGKTYAMLAEGHRRLARGADVVVGLAEDHGRVHTAEQLRGLSVLPRRSFTQHGGTFTDLVTERRMERAQELLANTAMRIADVAHASGFADEGYFTRRFRQWFGTTPRLYRESVRAAVTSQP